MNKDTNDKPTEMQLEEAKKCKTKLLLMSKQVKTQSSELRGNAITPSLHPGIWDLL